MSRSVIGFCRTYIYVTRVSHIAEDIRPGLRDIELSESTSMLETHDLPAEHILSEEEIVDAFNKAKRYLQEFRDNLAMVEINRILLSNASLYVKEEASLLASLVETPDFSTVKDPFLYEKVRLSPLLYQNCYIVWEGKVANVEISPDLISFDLLVGYQNEQELMGVVPVSLDYAINLVNGIALRVLGKVVAKEEVLGLEAVSTQRIYSTE